MNDIKSKYCMNDAIIFKQPLIDVSKTWSVHLSLLIHINLLFNTKNAMDDDPMLKPPFVD